LTDICFPEGERKKKRRAMLARTRPLKRRKGRSKKERQKGLRVIES